MNKFFKQILASFFGSLAGLLFFFFLSSTGIFVFILTLSLADKTPPVKDRSVLVFNLATTITDSRTNYPLEALLSDNINQNLSVRQIIEAIERAAGDERIVALFLDGRGGNIDGGYANLSEIRQALQKFKNSGKQIISYHLSLSEKDYYLASVADRIVVNPMGLIEINGFSSPQLFFASALDKYGIGVQVVRVGKYKTAVEPFTRNNYSEENRQQTAKLLNDLWKIYIDKISVARSMPSAKIQEIADKNAILQAPEAEKIKLVDGVLSFEEIKTNLQEISNSKNGGSFPEITINKYLDARGNKNLSKNKIAIIYADGTIVTGEGKIGEIGSENFSKQLEKLRKNQDIKGVILRINSPGGSALASDVILQQLKILAREKKLIVSMGNVAASGGYWLAMAGDKIFAERETITGSIGVFGLLLNIQEIANDNGINYDVVKTGKLADIDVGFRPKTEPELNIFQNNVEQIYDLFLNKVAKSRNLSLEKLSQIAQGKVWSGQEAKEIGLIDEIGGLQAAVNYLVEELKLGDDWQIQEYPEQISWEAQLIARLTESNSDNPLSHQAIAENIWKLQSELELEQLWENPHDIYAILPFKIEIK